MKLLVGVLRLFQKIIKAEIAFAGSVEPDQINICVREQGEIKLIQSKTLFFPHSTLRLFLLRMQQNATDKRQ